MAKFKVFSTSGCVYCKELTDYLRSNDAEFEEVIIDQYPEEIQASLDTCGSRAVPCTHVTFNDGSEEQILGFNQTRIDQALNVD